MIRRAFYQLHLWVGMCSGVILFLISIAAAGFVFEQELRPLLYRDLYAIEAPADGTPLVPLEQLRTLASEAAGHPVQQVERPIDPTRSWIMVASRKAPDEAPGLTWLADYEYQKQIFVDPYRGRVLGVQDLRTEPITLFRVMHQQLMLRHDVGEKVVGVAALIFFGMILTGLILWWPRRWRSAGQRFKIKTDGSRRRLTWDLHAVGGFYIHFFILMQIATGLVWSFDWWEAGAYRLMGEASKPSFDNRPIAELPAEATRLVPSPGPMTPALGDHLLSEAVGKYPTARQITLAFPDPGQAPTDKPKPHYILTINYPGTTGWPARDRYAADPATGEVVSSLVDAQKSEGQRWRHGHFDLHTGRLYGRVSKTIAFFVSLFAASLPVTGFLIWWGRKKKTSRRSSKATSATLSRV